MKIAPNLLKHMKVVRKGTKRPAENTNIVSPPRRVPRTHMPLQPTHVAPYHPGFMSAPDVFKKKARSSIGSSGNGSSEIILPSSSKARTVYTENREDLTADPSSPERTGPRCVSFQERLDGDSSPNESSNNPRHRSYESPRSHPEIQLNFVSPGNSHNGHHVSVRSNRGGSRFSSSTRVVLEREDSGGSSSSSRKFSSVSNRGRGHRNISSRGRASKSENTMRLEKERIVEGNDDEPLIIKALENVQHSVKEEGEKCS